MATNFKRSNAAVTEEADRVCALLNNGYLRIYDGAQPANADTAVGAQTLLAELRWNAAAFAAAVNGVAAANAITSDSAANATGTASWFRALKSDGTTVVFDDTVGDAGDAPVGLQLNSKQIQQNAQVSVSGYSYTANKG